MTATPSLAMLVERFFTQRLMPQRQASPHTISASRDPFRLRLVCTQQHLRKPPSRLARTAIDAPLIVAFLAEMEQSRGMAPRSRHLRLPAIRSFFQDAAFAAPAQSAQSQRVLAMPGKRSTRAVVACLTRPAVDARLATPDQRTWSGRRAHACFVTAVQTGWRLSELTGLQPQAVTRGTGAASPRGGQGTQGTRHAAEQADGGRLASLATRASARRYAPPVSPRPWWTPQCRRGARHPGAASRGGLSAMPRSPAEAGDAAWPAPPDGHGPLTSGGRSRRHRPVARA
jgi:site-specific recombinase XerC